MAALFASFLFAALLAGMVLGGAGRAQAQVYINGTFHTASGTTTVSGSTITTTGDEVLSVGAIGAGAGVIFNNGTITTTGNGAWTLFALNGGYLSANNFLLKVYGNSTTHTTTGMHVENATATLTNGTIFTFGSQSPGLGSKLGGKLTASNVTVETFGAGFGIHVLESSTASLTDGTVTTRGLASLGVGVVKQSAMSLDRVKVSTTGNGAVGLAAYDSGTLKMENVDVSTTGSTVFNVYAYNDSYSAHGVHIRYNSTGILNNARVSTSGSGSMGVNVSNTSALSGSNVLISTGGNSAHGVFAEARGTVALTNGTITTSGQQAHGVYAATTSSIALTGGTVSTSGYQAHGIFAAQNAAVTANNTRITATGTGAHGVRVSYSSTATLSNLLVSINGGGAAIGNAGVSADGNLSYLSLANSKVESIAAAYSAGAHSSNRANILLTSSTLSTLGYASYGVIADNSARLSANNVLVTTSGSGAHGIVANSAGVVGATNVRVTTTGSDAAGISVADAGTVTVQGGTFNVAGPLVLAGGTGMNIVMLERVVSTNGTNLITASGTSTAAVTVLSSTLRGDVTASQGAAVLLSLGNIGDAPASLTGAAHRTGTALLTVTVSSAVGSAWYVTGSSQLTYLSNNRLTDLVSARIGSGAARLLIDSSFIQTSSGQLKIAMDAASQATGALSSASAIITASSASLAGVLDVSGVSGLGGGVDTTATKASEVGTGVSATYVAIATSGAGKITGNFDSVIGGGVTSGTSFLDYIVSGGGATGGVDATRQYYLVYSTGGGLSWFASPDFAHGTFTISYGNTFEVDVALTTRTGTFGSSYSAPYKDWDGGTLTKNGQGTLIVSSPADLTRAIINAGTAIFTGPLTVTKHGIQADGEQTFLILNNTQINQGVLDVNTGASVTATGLNISGSAGNGFLVRNGASLTANGLNSRGNVYVVGNDSSVSASNVLISDSGDYLVGAYVIYGASLTLANGTIAISGSYAKGVRLEGDSMVSLQNMHVTATGSGAVGLSVADSGTATVTNGTFNGTGALVESTGSGVNTVTLDHVTFTSGTTLISSSVEGITNVTVLSSTLKGGIIATEGTPFMGYIATAGTLNVYTDHSDLIAWYDTAIDNADSNTTVGTTTDAVSRLLLMKSSHLTNLTNYGTVHLSSPENVSGTTIRIALDGAYTQYASGMLSLALDNAAKATGALSSASAIITASSGALAGVLDVTGITGGSGGGVNIGATKASEVGGSAGSSGTWVVIATSYLGELTGSFSSIIGGGVSSTSGLIAGFDYLYNLGGGSALTGSNTGQYYVVTGGGGGGGLSWFATPELAHGTFTIAAGNTFDVDIALGKRTGAPFGGSLDTAYKGWDGGTLTKSGSGTLIVSGTADIARVVVNAGRASFTSTSTFTASGTHAAQATGTGSLLTLNNTRITTSGAGAQGLHAELRGRITLTGGSIGTTGDQAHGVYATTGGVVFLTNGTIATGGAGAHGIVAANGGSVSATNVLVTATGAGAAGIGLGAGANEVYVTNGTFNVAGPLVSATNGAGSVWLNNVSATHGGKLLLAGNNLVTLDIRNSSLGGDVEGLADVYLREEATWEGAANATAVMVDDATAAWVVTKNSELEYLSSVGMVDLASHSSGTAAVRLGLTGALELDYSRGSGILAVALDEAARVGAGQSLESASAIITTEDRATLGGTLSIASRIGANGIDANAAKASQVQASTGGTYVVIRAAGGIRYDFHDLVMPSVASGTSAVDYITADDFFNAYVNNDGNFDYYIVEMGGGGLSWFAAPELAHGTFTIAAGKTFEVDIALNKRTDGPFGTSLTSPYTGWDGGTLTKNGEGTLVVSGSADLLGVVVNVGTASFTGTSRITSTANNAPGARVSWEGSVLNLANSTITTSGSAAHGIVAERGGAVSASNVRITTTGSGATGIAVANAGMVAVQGGTFNVAGVLLLAEGTGTNSVTLDRVASTNGTNLIINSGTNVTNVTVLSSTLKGGVIATAGTLNVTIDPSDLITWYEQSPGATINTTVGTPTDSVSRLLLMKSSHLTNLSNYGTVHLASSENVSGTTIRVALDGAYTQYASGKLSVAVDDAAKATGGNLASGSAIITASSAALGGSLEVTSLSATSGSVNLSATKASEVGGGGASGTYTVIAASAPGKITGNFGSVTLNGGTAGASGTTSVDYIVSGGGSITGQVDATAQYYYVTLATGGGLSWFASPNLAHGTFTIGAGNTFEVDIALTRRTDGPFGASYGGASGLTDWDGGSLHKKGEGTLVISGTANIDHAWVTGGTLSFTGETYLVGSRNDNMIYSSVVLAQGTNSVATLASGTLIHTGTGEGATGLYASGGGRISATNVLINTSHREAVIASRGSVAITNGTIITGGSNGLRSVWSTGSSSRLDLLNVTISVEGYSTEALAAGNGGQISASNVLITTQVDNSGGVQSGYTNSFVTLTNGTIFTAGKGSHGLHAYLNSLLTASNVQVTTTGSDSFGIFVSSNGTATITNGSIGTFSNGAHAGILSNSGALTLTNGTLTTWGDNSNGVDSNGKYGNPGGIAELNNTRITTYGAQSSGVAMGNKSTATLNNVVISTTGQSSYGLYAYNANSLITGSGVDVATSGNTAHGATVSGSARIELTDGIFNTTGNTAYGLYVEGSSASLSASNIYVHTAGNEGVGAYARVGGTLALTGGTIITLGNEAHGVASSGTISNSIRAHLDLNNVSITTSGSNAHGIAMLPYSSTYFAGAFVTGSGLKVVATGSGAMGILVSGSSVVDIQDSVFTVADALVSATGNGSSARENTVTLDHVTATNGTNLFTITGTAKTTLNLAVTSSTLSGNILNTTTGTLNVTLADVNARWIAGAGASNLTSLTNQGTVNLASGGNTTRLNVAQTYNQTAGAGLNVLLTAAQLTTVSGTTATLGNAIVSASSASLNGTMNVSGFSVAALTGTGLPGKASEVDKRRYTVIATSGSNKIAGDFSAVTGITGASPVDYLTLGYGKDTTARYWQIGYFLTWFSGSTSSSGTFTVTGDSTFIVDTPLTQQTPNAGTGWNGSDLDKNGNGKLVLQGDQTGVGEVNVNDGTLIVDGTTGHPGGGPFIIHEGAVGGGEGVIDTDVIVEPGGTISPGGVISGSDINIGRYPDPGLDAGKLVITGNLTMEPGSDGSRPAADFTLGEADYPIDLAGHNHSDWNDLLVVGGNLTLDGYLNVKETPGSPEAGLGFKPGYYSVIHYGGTLTDNGIQIGTLPNELEANRDVYLQTSIDHTVNLIVMGNSKPPGGSTWPTDPDGDSPIEPGGEGKGGGGPIDPDNLHGQVVWWDGAKPASSGTTSPNNRNDGKIGGGEGIWQGWNKTNANGDVLAWGNDNWTTGSDYSKGPGYVNAAWEAYAYAHFTTVGGTVTIDNTTAGQVKASGAEFHVGGYIITGGDLLIGGTSDAIFNTNTAASATTTIASNVRDYSSAGSNYITGLTKTGAGVLAIAGTASYGGDTQVTEGKLIVSGAITGSPTVNVLAGAVLTDNGIVGTGTTQVNVAGTLSGNGTVKGSVVARHNGTGGTISPGAGGNNGLGSYGRLTVEKSFTLDSASTLALDIGGPSQNANAGTSYDTLNVGAQGGTITLAGTLDINFDLANINVGDSFTLIRNLDGSAIGGDFAQVLAWGRVMTEKSPGSGIYILDGLSFQLSKLGDGPANSLTGGNDLVLSMLAIPEPGTWAMMLGGMGMLLAAQRLRLRGPRQAA